MKKKITSPNSKIPCLFLDLTEQLPLHLDFDNPLHTLSIRLVNLIQFLRLHHQSPQIIVFLVDEQLGGLLGVFLFQEQVGGSGQQSGGRLGGLFGRGMERGIVLAKKLGKGLKGYFLFCEFSFSSVPTDQDLSTSSSM